jgi:hypothetical protein
LTFHLRFSKHLLSHNIKYDEKEHGYRETEINWRQLFAESLRRPQEDAGGEPGMEIVDEAPTPKPKHKRTKKTVAPSHANVLPFPQIAVSSESAIAVPWNPTQLPPYAGYGDDKNIGRAGFHFPI